jgi:hypothetical protein
MLFGETMFPFITWLFSCSDEGELSFLQFNSLDDQLSISVGTEEILPDKSIPLFSSTGAIEVGNAIVSPGGGPFGTEHAITVEVFDAFEDKVSYSSIRTMTERGTETYTMNVDSADEGLYVLDLVSIGVENETREDIFYVTLYRREDIVEESLDTGN